MQPDILFQKRSQPRVLIADCFGSLRHNAKVCFEAGLACVCRLYSAGKSWSKDYVKFFRVIGIKPAIFQILVCLWILYQENFIHFLTFSSKRLAGNYNFYYNF